MRSGLWNTRISRARAGDVPGDLQVLALVLSHRDKIGLVQQNVGSHKGGVGKQPGVDVVGIPGRLILELGHPAQFPKLGVAVKDPGPLGVVGVVALDKEDALFRVQTAGHKKGVGLQGVPPQGSGVLPDGNGVKVRHTVETVIVLLERGPVTHRPDVVAQGKDPCGLDGGKDDLSPLPGSGWRLFHDR